MRIVVWGTGFIANRYMARKAYHSRDEIIAFVDNNRALWGKRFRNIEIIAPDKLKKWKFDQLVICTIYSEEIKKQLNEIMQIDCSRVITYFEVEEQLKKQLIEKYKDIPDQDIQNVLNYYSNSDSVNIYGSYEGKDETIYPVAYESDGMPYVIFENKRMFFPRSYKFSRLGDMECVKNILYEQGKHSPHQYIRSDAVIRKNMVIVDAGTCEGNFALRYVEDAKKVYLIEPDPEWTEALNRTFKPYRDKVVICDKYLSGKDTEQTITLDTLIDETIDLLKMDIEGYETEALKGAKRVLRESNAYCAICSYHRHGDEKKIKKLLQDYGYHTEASEGYMFFVYDAYLELRRGIVYGGKCCVMK